MEEPSTSESIASTRPPTPDSPPPPPPPPPPSSSPHLTSLHEHVFRAYVQYFLSLTLSYPFWLYRLYIHGSQFLGESPMVARRLALERLFLRYISVVLVLAVTYSCMALVADDHKLVFYIPGNLIALTNLFWGGNEILRLVQEIAEKCGVVTQPAQRYQAYIIGIGISIAACGSMILSPLCFLGWLVVAQIWLNRAIEGDSRAY